MVENNTLIPIAIILHNHIHALVRLIETFRISPVIINTDEHMFARLIETLAHLVLIEPEERD